ncbi:hypothetical protein HZA33_01160 [Candidatus Pacearchaeota archaeon]|nr:hypothetical protein [Candidatus Pacearchaeota archaeon]
MLENKWSFYGGIGLATLGLMALFGLRNSVIYHAARQTALVRYADTNRDHVVSSEEERAFDMQFLKANGLKKINSSEEVYNKEGNHISYKTLTALLEQYNPKN